MYRYESVTVNFFPQDSDLIYQGIFSNATSLAELGNTSKSLGLTNMSERENNTLVDSPNNNTTLPIEDLVSLSNPVDTLTRMIINVLQNTSIPDTQNGKDLGLKNYYELGGSWNLVIRGDEFSNFTGVIRLNNTLNNITKNYDIKLVTSTANNITYEASNQIIKIKGTGDLTFDDQTTNVQLLVVLYKNENIYVVFASKTEENLFDNFLVHGNILQRKFEY
ncbi:MAG TPA: hypothetical protein VD710_01510 [Nitrososphaeraceae archaeon]|nr:hypothetical protein [Nitrososphaeraceae archaeon]